MERQKREVWPKLNSAGIKTVRQFPKEGKICQYPRFNLHITFSKSFSDEQLKRLPEFEEPLILEFTNFIFKF